MYTLKKSQLAQEFSIWAEFNSERSSLLHVVSAGMVVEGGREARSSTTTIAHSHN